jgi:type I restriction enzyme R subunit
LDLLAKLFYKFDSKPYFNGTPLQRLDCLNRASEFIQLTDEMEKRFIAIVKKLRSAYDLCCSSDQITNEQRDYVHFYFAIKAIIHKITKGEAPDTSQMNERVRKMIEEALISDGVEEIFKIDKNNPSADVDIFSDEYLAKIDKIKLPNTKIKLLQKLLSKAIEEFKKTNRIKGVDFSKRLKALIDIYNERSDFEVYQSDILDDVAQQFADLFKELQKDRNSFEELGINFEEKAFYDILKAIASKYKFEYPEDKLLILAQAIKNIVDDKAQYTDWAQRDDIKAELKVALILILAEHGYPPVPKDEIFKEIFEQAENFKKYTN